jgi:hypothetical protein
MVIKVNRLRGVLALAALTSAAFSAQDKAPTWAYFLTNTQRESGLIFNFENAADPEAKVKVTVTVDGRAFTKEATVHTRRGTKERDIGLVSFAIGNPDTLTVVKVTITMGGWYGMAEFPRTAVQYEMVEE